MGNPIAVFIVAITMPLGWMKADTAASMIVIVSSADAQSASSRVNRQKAGPKKKASY